MRTDHEKRFPVWLPGCRQTFWATLDIGDAKFEKRPRMSYDQDADELVIRFKIANPFPGATPTTTETPMNAATEFTFPTRDELAMTATDSDIADFRYSSPGTGTSNCNRAQARYAYADAMIKARGEESMAGLDAKRAQAQAQDLADTASKWTPPKIDGAVPRAVPYAKRYIVLTTASDEHQVRSPRLLTSGEAKQDAEALLRQGYLNISIHEVRVDG